MSDNVFELFQKMSTTNNPSDFTDCRRKTPIMMGLSASQRYNWKII